MALYTVILEYDDSNFVRQIRAGSPMSAVLEWTNLPDILQLFKLESPGIEPFLEKEDARPTPIAGCINTWCTSFIADEKFGLITVSKTVDPIVPIARLAHDIGTRKTAIVEKAKSVTDRVITRWKDFAKRFYRPVEVQRWIDRDEAENYEPSVGGWGGWFNADEKGMRWKEYMHDVLPEDERYYEAIRRSVIENGLRFTGAEHQQHEHGTPFFDDETVGMFTFTAWGDLMAAIWSEEEDKDYTFMDFYC